MQHIEFTQQAPDDVQFYFQGWQPEIPPKAVVCLVHGLGEHSGRCAHVAAALNDAGYALFGFDLRGHGKSGGPRGHTPTYDTLMDDIGRLLTEAAQHYPGRPQFLYGHSLGGNLVLNYALRRCSGQALRRKPGLALDGLARDPEVIRAYTSDPLVHNKISVRLATGMLDAGEWALAHAAEFPLPLLLVHGTADILTSAKATEEFAASVPAGRCTLKLWEGFHHETHNEPEKAEVLAYMVDWLRAHTIAK